MARPRREKPAPHQAKAPLGANTAFGTALGRAELTVALLITALAAVFHVAVFQHAGPLWRDEVNSINMARMPSLADIWNNLQFDSFPMVWFLILRAWTAVTGPANDTALRLLGLVVGLGLLGVLWLCFRRWLKLSLPLVALVLIGLNPATVRWGDSLRAWGFGSLTLVLAAGLLWQVAQGPTKWRVVLAALAAILAVQTLYHNAFLLFALGAAGMVVAARRRLWRRAGLVAAIGLAAALSLLPYSIPVTRAAKWNMILGIAPGFAHYWSVFAALLGSAGSFMITAWVALMIVAVIATVVAQWPRLSPGLSNERRDLALFAGLTLVIGLASYAAFIRVLNYGTNPWYYVALAVLAAVALEAALGAFLVAPWLRIARLAVAAVLAAACLNGGWNELQTRQTNIDMIAADLQSTADKNDLILVSSWSSGLTFDRYYHGATPWTTIPPFPENKVHRSDLVKEFMMQREAVRPNLAAIEKTLRSGHRVWLVGVLPYFQPGQHPSDLPLPPLPGSGWFAPPYEAMWPAQVGYFLQTHINFNRDVQVKQFGEQISPYENTVLEVVQNWHD